jgi:hypothetical protein
MAAEVIEGVKKQTGGWKRYSVDIEMGEEGENNRESWVDFLYCWKLNSWTDIGTTKLQKWLGTEINH